MIEQLRRAVTESILFKTKYVGLGYPAIIDEVCEKNNLVFEMNPDTNGWEVDWWGEIKTESGEVYGEAHGSMYYGSLRLNFNR